MASTYSPGLGIELPGTGDQAGVWGNTTNTNLGTLIEQAISGYATQAVATGTDTTITIPNGATGVARNMYLELTGTGGASTNLIVPANKKLYFIFNNTSSGQVTVKVSGQTGVSVPNGKKMILVSNGTDIVTAENYVASLSSDNLSLTGSLSVGTTSAFTGVATFTANPVLNGGTANGVLYLNGSKVATSGSALVFDGTNLGVGVTPSYKLDVLGSGATAAFRINNATAGKSAMLVQSNGATAGIIGLTGFVKGDSSTNLGFFAETGFDLRFYTNGSATEKAVIDTSGNLGIGTASPGYRLTVSGGATSLAANQYLRFGAGIFASSDGSVDNYLFTGSTALRWRNSADSAELMQLTNSGNLGIGTSSFPSDTNFTVLGDFKSGFYRNVTSGDRGYFLNIGAKTSGGFADGGYIFGAVESGDATGYLAFGTRIGGSTTERMRLDSSGNLGLGVTPSANGGLYYRGFELAKVGSGIHAATTSLTASELCWLTNNSYPTYSGGTVWKYGNDGPAARYALEDSAHTWFTAGSGTANNTISWGDPKMTLDADGRLMVGATSATGGNFFTVERNSTTLPCYANVTGGASETVIANLDPGALITLKNLNTTNNIYTAIRGTSTNGTTNNAIFFVRESNSTHAGSIAFGTTNSSSVFAERGRFTAGGAFLVGGTSAGNYRLKAEGAIYGRSEFTTYVADGLFGATAVPSVIQTPASGQNQIRFGYTDSGGGQYVPRIGFNQESPATAAQNSIGNETDGTFTIRVGTSNQERARFTTGGYFKASSSGTYAGSTGAYHELYKAENNADWTAVVTHAGATAGNQYGIRIDLTGDPNGTGNEFWLCRGNLTTRAAMRSNGGLANYQTNDVNLSDERTKKDIAPLGSMWAKIKALEIVTFKYKDQTHDDDNIGLIAQQVESVAPEFVDVDGWGETPEDGVPLKSIYTADMYHAAIKALQEAMARIESLETKVAALEAK